MTKRKLILVPIILVLLNLILKGFYLSSNSIGGDEPFSIYYSQMDILSIINLLSTGNNPPLYEILLHFWTDLFGVSEFAVRSLSLVFSSITVLYIYQLCRKFLNSNIAIYSSIIFIFSNYHIAYAHEARVYALVGMLSIMSMYYFLGLISNKTQNLNGESLKSSLRGFVLLLLVNVLLIYSHYFGIFILGIQFSFILFHRKLFTRFWKHLFLALGIVIVFYSPNIVVLIHRFTDSSTNGTWLSPPNGIESIYNMLRVFSNAPVVAVLMILVCFSALTKYFINRKQNRAELPFKLIVFWFVFIFFFMFGISYFIPMFLDRYLMPAAIAFVILLGISSDYLVKTKQVKYAIPIVVCILFIATSKPNLTNKRNVRETVQKVKNIKGEQTLVLICPANFMLNYSYYHSIDVFRKYDKSLNYDSINRTLNKEHIYGINNIVEVDFEKWNHIVYLDAAASFTNPDNNIRQAIETKYELKSESEFHEIFNIYEYKLR